MTTHQNKEGLEDSAVAFLREMAAYFERRPTNGEDMAFWANVTNKQNCEGIAKLLSSLSQENERLRKERDEALADTVDKSSAWDGANASWQKGYDRGKSAADAALSASQAREKIYSEAIEFVRRWAIDKEGNGTSAEERLSAIANHPGIKRGLSQSQEQSK